MSVSIEWSMAADRKIRADFYPAERESVGTLLVCHGFKGFKDWGFFPYIGKKLSHKLDVIVFNFSHNGIGENGTDFTELDKFALNTYSRELEDLDFVVHAVRDGLFPEEKRPQTAPLFVLGHSRGAGVALIYALDHPDRISGVVSWNGITHPDFFEHKVKEQINANGIGYVVNARTGQQMPLSKEILDDMERNADRYDIVGRAKGSRLPILLVQGTEDYARLVEGSKKLLQARPDIEWHRVEGGTHAFNVVHPFQGTSEPLEEALRVSSDWIMKLDPHAADRGTIR
ncbi:S9 family peptidase [Paenibacillus sp. 32O-W]|uniref:alpha/beta hydrolase family protein n=1 Tax=Paenibacillus sp. 32O-W TaxID=1695218 RepID=UPI0021B62143|nr:alpha/beta fold hydrolase [Paenibacillus sp. 32O-W]